MLKVLVIRIIFVVIAGIATSVLMTKGKTVLIKNQEGQISNPQYKKQVDEKTETKGETSKISSKESKEETAESKADDYLNKPVLPNVKSLPEEKYPLRWVYYSVNFQVNEQVDRLIEIMTHAKEVGYNGIVITDYKFGKIKDRISRYYTNLRRTRETAEKLDIELIPVVMSPSILINDPNMVEGIPVKDCEFIVKNDKATLKHKRGLLPGGDFESMRNEVEFEGWNWIDGPGISTFPDRKIKHSGQRSIRMENFREGNEYGNCRINKKLTLKPWTQYHVSLFVKTKNVSPAGENIKIALLAEDGRNLNHRYLGVKSTQDWKKHEITFNTLEHSTVRFYMGIWSGNKGTMWIDDITLTKTAGVNLVRRKGCPVKVTSADGVIEFVEDKDFERWVDQKSGHSPWAGSFDNYHTPPPIVITENSRIKEGQTLLVSYYHTVPVTWGAVFPCLLNEDLFTYYEEQIRELNKYFRPEKYFMAHDEIRLAGWCETCSPHGTCGDILAEHISRCVDLIKSINSDADIFVWSDMFDPYHNAKKHPYYLCSSSFEGSWEGLDKSVIIVNWYRGKREKNMPFFEKRGHRQLIAGYYDSADVKNRLKAWLNTADNIEGVVGVMYTTWQNNYSHLDVFYRSLIEYGVIED